MTPMLGKPRSQESLAEAGRGVDGRKRRAWRGLPSQRMAWAVFLLMVGMGPGLTSSQGRLLPTQIAVTEVPFFTSRQVQGGVAFDGTVAELKDAGYTTLDINDGRYMSVDLVSDGGGSFLEGPSLEKRFGVSAFSGIARFDTLVIKKVCTQCRLRFVSGSLQVLSVAFDVTQGPPSGMSFLQMPTQGALGIDVDPQPSLQVTDLGGNVVLDRFTVGIRKEVGVGFIRQRQNNLFVDSGGADNIATFSGIFFDTPADVTLGFNATFASGAVVDVLVPGLKITGIVSVARLGTPFVTFTQSAVVPFDVQPVITVFDFLDNIVTTATDSKLITASILSGTTGSSLLGSTVVRTQDGVATFTNLAVDKVGVDYQLQFQVEEVINVTTPVFNITPGIAQRLVIVSQPLDIVAGSHFAPDTEVAIRDAGGNNVPGVFSVGVVIDDDSNPANASIIGPGPLLVNTVGGVATFVGLSVNLAGVGYRLVFFLGGGFVQLSEPFTVSPGAANRIAVDIQPGSALRGVVLSRAPTVQLLDALGNPVSGDAIIVSATASILNNPGSGTLGGTLTRSFVGGTATFDDLSVNNVANGYTLRFLANQTLTADSAFFDITGTAQSVVVLQQPGGAVGGIVFEIQPRVAAIDSAGLVVATRVSNVSVSIGTNPGGGSLDPPLPWVVTQFGVAEFGGISIDRAGIGYTLAFSVLNSRGQATGTIFSQPFDVAVGSPTGLAFLAEPLPTLVAGTTYFPLVTVGVVDAGNNVVNINATGLAGEVLLGETQLAQLQGEIIKGEARFDVPLNQSGANLRMRFSLVLPGGAPTEVFSRYFEVQVGPAASLLVVTQPYATIANIPNTNAPIIISVADAGGNPVPTYTEPVTVSRHSGPSASYVLGNLTVTPVGGLATFDQIFISDTASEYVVSFATKPSPTSDILTILSQTFTVTLPVASAQVESAPRFAKGGEPFDVSIVVSFRDNLLSVVQSNTEQVSANISTGPAGAVLTGFNVVTAQSGVATFSGLGLLKTGIHVLEFVGLTSGYRATTSIDVEVGDPWSLFILQQPTNFMDSLLVFDPPVVQVLDRGGNVVIGAIRTISVTLNQNSDGALLTGNTSIGVQNGQVSFANLTIAGIGNGFTLLFTSSTLQVESIQFSVHGAAVQGLTVLSFPAGVLWSTPIQAPVRVAVLDEAYNIITGGGWRPPHALVSVALHSVDEWSYYGTFVSPRLELGGTTSVVVKEGVAVFDNLVVTGDGGGAYHGIRLTFSTNVSSATVDSAYFSATNQENKLVLDHDVLPLQSSGVALSPFPRIFVVDGLDKTVRGSSLSVVASLASGPSSAVLAGTLTLPAAGGVFTFTDLSVSRATGAGEAAYSVKFEVVGGGATSVTSSTFTISIGDATALRLDAQPIFGASGALFLSQPCVALVDAGDNLILTEKQVLAALEPAEGGELLLGVTNITSSGGKASFTNLRVNGAVLGRPYLIRFSSDGGLTTVSQLFNGAPGLPASGEVLVNPPISVVAAQLFEPAPTVLVRDAGGTPVADGTPVIASLLGAPGGAMLSGATALTQNGTATFQGMSVDKAGGAMELSFVSLSAPPSISRTFSVRIGVASVLGIGVQPPGSVFGVPFSPSPTVAALDLGGNLVTTNVFESTVELVSPAPVSHHALDSVLTGVMAQTASGGRVVFPGLSVRDAGVGYKLRFHAAGLPSILSNSFDITGPPALLGVDVEPMGPGGAAASHTPLWQQPVVHVRDFGGGLVASTDVPQGVSVSVQGGGVLSGATTVDVVAGVARFADLSVRTAGPVVRLVFSYGGPQLSTSVVSSPFVVLSGPPHSLVVLTQPSSGVRGVTLGQQPTVALLDVYSNSVTWLEGSTSALLLGLGGSPTATPLIGGASVPLVRGQGAFTDLMLDEFGLGYHLRFGAAGLSVDSDAFDVQTGPPAGLKLKTTVLGGASTVDGGLLYPSPVVQVVDDGNGLVPSFDGVGGCTGKDCAVSVRIVCCPIDLQGVYIGAGVLTGTTTVIAVGGEATFGDLAIAAQGDYTLQFDVAEIGGISLALTMQASSIPVQVPNSIAIVSEPGQAVLGMPMRFQPILRILDTSGAVVNGSHHNVTLSIVDGVGCTAVSGSQVVEAYQGVATFTDIAITGYSGTVLCKFNFTMDQPPAYILSSDFTIAFGPASLSLSVQPAASTAGSALATQPIIKFADPTGSLLQTEQGRTVSASLVLGSATGLAGTTSVPMLNGFATFTDLSVASVSATAQLRFTMGLFVADSNMFGVTEGVAASLVVVQQPTDVQISTSIGPAVSVQARDAGGNAATAFASAVTGSVFPAVSGATLTGNVVTASSGGLAVFAALQMDTPIRMLQLKFTAGSLEVTTSTFNVHGTPSIITIENFLGSTLGSSASVVSATAIEPRVQVSLYDLFGILALTRVDQIDASLEPNIHGAVLEGTVNATAEAGVAFFHNLSISKACTGLVMRFTVHTDSSMFVLSPPFEVLNGPAASLTVIASPSTVTAGLIVTPFPVVQAVDAFGNLVVSGAGSATVCVQDPMNGGMCLSGGGSTTTQLMSGVATFTDLRVIVPPQTGAVLLFTVPGGSGSVTALSVPFEVWIGVPTMQVHTQPSLAAEGEVFGVQPVVQVQDFAGTVVGGGAEGSIEYLEVTASLLAQAMPAGVLSGPEGNCPCTVPFIEGRAVFSGLKVSLPGSFYVIRFTSPMLVSNSVDSEPFAVTGQPLYPAFTAPPPSSVLFGVPFPLKAHLIDANLLEVAAPNISVRLLDSPSLSRSPPGRLSIALSSVSAVTGEADFGQVSVTTPGDYVLRLSGPGPHALLESDSLSFTINSGAPHSATMSVLPREIPAAVPLVPAPTLTLLDDGGFVSTSFSGPVNFTVLDSVGTIIQNFTANASSGVATLTTFAPSLVGGPFTLHATAIDLSLSADTFPFRVTPGPLDSLVIVTQPGDGIVNIPLATQPVVEARDGAGNMLVEFVGQVKAMVSSTASPISFVGAATAQAVAGRAVFSDLTFNDTSTSVIISFETPESCGRTVTASAVASTQDSVRIEALNGVSDIKGGLAFGEQPNIAFRDAMGVTVTASQAFVTASVCSGTGPSGSGELRGTVSIAATSGVARFTDLTLDTKGDYTLCFSSGSFAQVNVSATVVQGLPAQIVILEQPEAVGMRAGEAITGPRIQVLDAGGNLMLTATTLQASIVDTRTRGKKPRILSISIGTWSEGAVDMAITGANVPSLKLERPGIGYRLKFAYAPTGTEEFSVVTDVFDVSVGRCSSLTVISQPGGALLGQPFQRPIMVEMQDSVGNGVVQERSPITVYIGNRATKDHSVDSTLSGCPTSVFPVDGVATFIGCTIACTVASQCAGTNFELLFTGPCEGVNQIAYSDVFTVSDAANEVRIRSGTVSSTAVAGVPFTLQPIIELWTSPCGAVASSECLVSPTTLGTTVSVYVQGGFSTTLGMSTVTVVNGIATFTDLAIADQQVAPYTLVFNRTGVGIELPTVTADVTVSVGPASVIVITSQPSLTAPGTTFACTAQLHDASGNLVDDSGEQVFVTIELADDFGLVNAPSLKTSQESLTQRSVSGAISWTGLSVDLAPVAYTFRVSATLASGTFTSVISDRIALAIGSLGEVRFFTQPHDVETTVAFSNDVVVYLYDFGGNLLRGTSIATTVTMSINAGGGTGTLGGTATQLSSATVGVATFPSLSVSYASGKSAHALRADVGGFFATSNPFFVHAAAASVVLRTFPTPLPLVDVALAIQPQVELRDGQANRARSIGSPNTVSVSAGAGHSNLQGSTSVTVDAGVASFTDLSFKATGSYTLTFTSSLGGFTVASSSLTVGSGPVRHIQVAANYQPAGSGTARAGSPLPVQPRIELLDIGAGAALGGEGTLVQVRVGSHPPGWTYAKKNAIYGTVTAIAGSTGVARFTDLTLSVVGNYSLAFSIPGGPSVESDYFMVTTGPVATMAYNTQPGDAVDGTLLTMQPVVRLMDLGGNMVKGSPWLHIALRSGGGALSGCDQAFAPEDSGVVTFSGCIVTGGVSGDRTLVVQTVEQGDVLTGAITGNEILSLVSAPFIVSGNSSSLLLATQADGIVSGVPFTTQPVVHVLDESGHIVAASAGLRVLAAPSDPSVHTLSGTTEVPVVRGVATFHDLSLSPAGPGGLVFYLNGTLTMPVNSSNATMNNNTNGTVINTSYPFRVTQMIRISPGPAATIALWPAPPAMVPAGAVLTMPPLMATLRDPDGVPTSAPTAALMISSPTCPPVTCLVGRLSLPASGGSASFADVAAIVAGTHEISIFAVGLNIPNVTFNLTVTPAAASLLKLTNDLMPAVFAGTPLDPAPSVRACDRFGNTVEDYAAVVTVRLSLSPSLNSGMLGPTSVNATQGIATFSGMAFDTAGSGFQLTFEVSTAGLSVASRVFTVSYPHTFLQLLDALPPTLEAGVPISTPSTPGQPPPGILVLLNDDAGLRAVASNETVTASIIAQTSTLQGNVTVQAVQGAAHFTDLAIMSVGVHRIHFSSSNGARLVTLTPPPITVIPGPPAELRINRQPGGLLEGGNAFPVPPVVLVTDIGGNLCSVSRVITATIHSSLSSASLIGNTSETSGGNFGEPLPVSSLGALTFSGLGIDKAGSGYVVRFSSPGLVPADTAALTILVGPASKLGMSTQPADVYTGVTFYTQPVVGVQDAGGNVVTAGSFEVSAAIYKHAVAPSLMTAVTLLGTTTEASTNGFATFQTLKLNHASFFCVLVFTTPGFTPAYSEAFSIGPSAPLSSCPGAEGSIALCGPDLNKVSLMSIDMGPGGSTTLATSTLAPLIVKLYDWDGTLLVASTGNATAAITAGTGAVGATLSGGLASMEAGVLTFGALSIDKASDTPYTVTVAFQSLKVTSDQFFVKAGPAVSLSLSALPIQLPVNTPLPNATATLRDAGNNVANETICSTLQLRVVTGPGAFSLSNSFNDAPGLYLVGGTIPVPGVYMVQAVCVVAGGSVELTSPSQRMWVLPYGAPAGVSFIVQPGNAALYVDAGATTQPYELSGPLPSVRLVDAAGNTIMGFVGFFRAATGSASTTGIVLGEADAFSFWASNGAATLSGLYFSLNTGTDPNGTAYISMGSSCCSLLALSAQDPSSGVDLTGAPTQLELTLNPDPVFAAGEAFTLTARVLPALANGAPVASYGETVTCALLESSTVVNYMSGPLQATAFKGIATFTPLAISTPGTYTIKCTAPRTGFATAELTTSTTALTIIVGPARGLMFFVQPTGCFGGKECTSQPVVGLIDGAGNRVESAGTVVTVSLEANGPQFPGPSRRHGGVSAVMAGTLTATTNSSGYANIPSMRLTYAGYRYRVVASASGLTSATSADVQVQVGSVELATVVREASGLVASEPYLWQPIAAVSDAGGNWISGQSVMVQSEAIISCPDASDPACNSFGNGTILSSDGVARFTDLGVYYAGTIQLRFKLQSVSTCGSVSCWTLAAAASVTPGLAAGLAITSTVNATFCASGTLSDVTVQVQDAAGNPVQDGIAYTISASLAGAGAASPLLGTTTRGAVAGTTTFSGLAVRLSCGLVDPKAPLAPCYNLRFTASPGGLSTTSVPFVVLAGNVTEMTFLDQPVDTSVGAAAGRPSVRLVDVYGNPVVQGAICSDSVFTSLLKTEVTPLAAEERMSSNVAILGGTFKNGTDDEIVSFDGASINWESPTCASAGNCHPPDIAGLTRVKMRATGRYLGRMADSEPFTVDVAQPANVRASSTTATHVTLTWNAPFHGPPPQAYRLRYGPVGGTLVADVQDIRATTLTIGPLPATPLYEFSLCSQSVLTPPDCSPFPPAAQKAAPVEPIAALEVYFVTRDQVGLRWDAPQAGPPPAAYQVTMAVGSGLETRALPDVSELNTTISGLNSNNTYVFRVYSLSAAGAFYAPTSPAPPPVTPTPAPSSVTLGCPLLPCTGNALQVEWTLDTAAPNKPTGHKITAVQHSITGVSNGSVVFTQESQVLVSASQQIQLISGLQRGIPLVIDIAANSAVNPAYFAPSATFTVVPTSPPSPPTSLVFSVENNTVVRADWQPPGDSGDGTTYGVHIDAYLVEFKVQGASSWTVAPVSGSSLTDLTRTITGLVPGNMYDIQVKARGLPSPGEVCLKGLCSPVSLPSEYGLAASGSILYGSVPVWVNTSSPPDINPPQLFKLFVGTLFEYTPRALGIDAGQNITITATGLTDCGARLVDIEVGNPAAATLRFDPDLRDMDKTFHICFTATDSLGAYSTPRCLRLLVAAPAPKFVSPLSTQEFVATIGCPINVDFTAHDETTAIITADEASQRGYSLSIGFVSSSAISAYGTVTSFTLPQGSAFSGMDDIYTNPQTRRLTWTPIRGQEAFAYSFCVNVKDSLKVLNTASGERGGIFCVTMTVRRCSYCLRRGDSLHSVANEWGTNWLNLWAGNGHILNPSIPLSGTPVELGPILITSVHDSLSGIAIRNGVSSEQILAWNPDLALAVAREGDVQLQQDKEVCVLPSTCVV